MSAAEGVILGLCGIGVIGLVSAYYHLRKAQQILKEVAEDMGRTVSGLTKFGEELEKLHQSVEEFGDSMQRAAYEAQRAAERAAQTSVVPLNARTSLRLVDSDEPGAG